MTHRSFVCSVLVTLSFVAGCELGDGESAAIDLTAAELLMVDQCKTAPADKTVLLAFQFGDSVTVPSVAPYWSKNDGCGRWIVDFIKPVGSHFDNVVGLPLYKMSPEHPHGVIPAFEDDCNNFRYLYSYYSATGRMQQLSYVGGASVRGRWIKHRHECDLEQEGSAIVFSAPMADQPAGHGSDRYRVAISAWLATAPTDHLQVFAEAYVGIQ